MAEKEYIEREAVVEAIVNQRLYYTFGDPNSNQGAYNMVKRITLLDAVKRIPAADVRPVVKATWKRIDFKPFGHDYECSACGWKNDMATHFCPSCGADMRPKPSEEET